ncbi:Integrator complex subunit 4, partial [Goodea atripinnis]
KQVYSLDSVDSGCGSGSVESAKLFLQQSLNRISTIQNLETTGAQDLLNFTIRMFLTELPHLQDSFVDKLLELMPRLLSCKPVELVKILQTTLRQSGLLQLRLPEQINRATATIIEPTGESDNPLRFTSGLVVALDIDATLEHVQDPQDKVKVQVNIKPN